MSGTCPTGWQGDTGECSYDVADTNTFSSNSGPLDPDASFTETVATFEEGGRDNGGFRTRCLVSHFSYSDPIVHGAEATVDNAHLHMFFGNTGAGAGSVNGGTTATGTNHLLHPNHDSTCGDLGNSNKSAYWIPALLNDQGDAVLPHQISVYYKTLNNGQTDLFGDNDFDGIPEVLDDLHPIPNDLQMLSNEGGLRVVGNGDSAIMTLRIEFMNCIAVEGGVPIGERVLSQQASDPLHRTNYVMKSHAAHQPDCDGGDGQDYVRVPGLEFNIQWRVEGNAGNRLANGDWSFSNGVGWDQVLDIAPGLSTNQEWPNELSPVLDPGDGTHIHRLHGDYMAAWVGNDSWDTVNGGFTSTATDAMSEVVDDNQRPISTRMTGEFDRLRNIFDVDGERMSESGGLQAPGGFVVAGLRLNNGTAVPCSIGGGAAPNCT